MMIVLRVCLTRSSLEKPSCSRLPSCLDALSQGFCIEPETSITAKSTKGLRPSCLRASVGFRGVLSSLLSLLSLPSATSSLLSAGPQRSGLDCRKVSIIDFSVRLGKTSLIDMRLRVIGEMGLRRSQSMMAFFSYELPSLSTYGSRIKVCVIGQINSSGISSIVVIILNFGSNCLILVPCGFLLTSRIWVRVQEGSANPNPIPNLGSYRKMI